MNNIKLNEGQQNKNEEGTEVASRIQRDSDRIRETCTKYLGNLIPWQPLKSSKKEDKWNYYYDNSRNMGWCLNAKVFV